MRQLWERVKCAFLPDRRRTLVGINAVAVVAAALVLTGASGARSSSGSARPVSGAAAQKQAVAVGIDIGAVVETAQRDVASAPETTSNPEIFAPPDLIVGESGGVTIILTVTSSDQGDSQVSVHYTTADSTATQGTVCGNGADYLIASGMLYLRAGGDDQDGPSADRRLPECRAVRGVHVRSQLRNQRPHCPGEQPDQHRRQRHDRVHAEAVRA